MNHGNKMKLKRALKDCGALVFGEFTLSSGKKSSYYVDIKKACSVPSILPLICNEIESLIESDKIVFNRVAGVVLGSVPLVVALSLQIEVPYVLVRKGKKGYGTGKEIEGTLAENDRVLVIEDVVTTASSAVGAIQSLREAGAVVQDLVAVVDRQEGAEERLRGIDVRLHSVLKAKDFRED